MDAHALAGLEGKSVLVTGAGGSIGSALCQLIVSRVRKLILVSISESALSRLRKKLGLHPHIEYVLADYGDSMRMTGLLRETNIVIHAGAHKHVDICEENPTAAILNNVWGTQKLLNACQVAGVQQFVQVSTDKAVDPTSIMGATKRVCELLCLRRDYGTMICSVVRFGNVLNSDGSVIPLWREQIMSGGPVTITDRRCTRYFMSVEDACGLILAVTYMHRPGLYVFDMGEPKRIEDIAQRMIHQIAPQGGIEIVEIGLRPGEKLEEELYTGGELVPTKHSKVMQVAEHGERQPSHQYVPDLVEHARKNRSADAVAVLWKIVNEAVKA